MLGSVKIEVTRKWPVRIRELKLEVVRVEERVCPLLPEPNQSDDGGLGQQHDGKRARDDSRQDRLRNEHNEHREREQEEEEVDHALARVPGPRQRERGEADEPGRGRGEQDRQRPPLAAEGPVGQGERAGPEHRVKRDEEERLLVFERDRDAHRGHGQERHRERSRDAHEEDGEARGGRQPAEGRAEPERRAHDLLELVGDERERKACAGGEQEREPGEHLEAGAGKQDHGRADCAHDGRRLGEFDALHDRSRSLDGAGPAQRQSAQSPETSSRWPVVTKPCAAEIRSSQGSSSQPSSSTTR